MKQELPVGLPDQPSLGWGSDAMAAVLASLDLRAAVGITHGWAKVTGRPMAVGLHSNVGLMNASMSTRQRRRWEAVGRVVSLLRW